MIYWFSLSTHSGLVRNITIFGTEQNIFYALAPITCKLRLADEFTIFPYINVVYSSKFWPPSPFSLLFEHNFVTIVKTPATIASANFRKILIITVKVVPVCKPWAKIYFSWSLICFSRLPILINWNTFDDLHNIFTLFFSNEVCT